MFMGRRESCFLLAALFLPWVAANAASSSYDLRSPDKRIEVRIRTANGIHYDVVLNGTALLQDCTFSIDVDHKTLGRAEKVLQAKERSHDEILEPVVRQKFAKIRDNYNELALEMEGGYAVVFRAYNEGAAYRFETSLPAAEGARFTAKKRASTSQAIPSCTTRRKTASCRTTNGNIFRSS